MCVLMIDYLKLVVFVGCCISTRRKNGALHKKNKKKENIRIRAT